jgi:iron(III) transport system substrate-binding protein
MMIRSGPSRTPKSLAAVSLAVLVSASLAACGSAQQAAAPAGGCGTDMAAVAESAKAEGAVSIYAPPGDVRPILVDAFGKDYPDLQVDIWSPGTNQSALNARLEAENAAKRIAADVIIGGYGPHAALDIYASLPDKIVLPETRDNDLWTTDGMLYQDPNKEFLVLQYDLGNTILVNTAAPGTGDLKSYEDLLKPEWKGKIIIGDPILNRQALYAYDALYKKYGEEFFAKLAANEPTVSGDVGQLVQTVAQGAQPIGIGAGSTVIASFVEKGAPIEGTNLENYSYVSAGYWAAAIPDAAPHPCAAQLYMNWLLTANAQASLSTVLGHAPLRTDVALPDGVQALPDDITGLVDPGNSTAQAYNEEVTEAFYRHIDGPGRTGN